MCEGNIVRHNDDIISHIYIAHRSAVICHTKALTLLIDIYFIKHLSQIILIMRKQVAMRPWKRIRLPVFDIGRTNGDTRSSQPNTQRTLNCIMCNTHSFSISFSKHQLIFVILVREFLGYQKTPTRTQSSTHILLLTFDKLKFFV